jgi:lysophospholipase L1-like esterase
MSFDNFYMKPVLHFTLNSSKDDLFFKDLPISKVLKHEDWTGKFKKDNEVCLSSELNSLNFRSDEFKINHDGLHVLFTGCSNTWGYGLTKDEMWSQLLYNKIKNNEKISGYFNLAIPATSILGQITNLFKYFNKFGNPDVIFFNMPDPFRFYSFENNRIIDASYDEKALPVLKFIIYQNYLMLDQYCNSNNIKLFSISWNETTQSIMSNLFKETYFYIEDKKLNTFIYDYKEKNNKEYSTYARDGLHFGIAYNEYWADFLYKQYLGLK